MYTNSNYWGDADVDHSQAIGGNTAKLLGGYIPPSPLVSAPLVRAVLVYTMLLSAFHFSTMHQFNVDSVRSKMLLN